MATYTLTAPTPEIVMTAGMQLRLEAIDPTTGDPVSGVTASAWSIYGDDMDQAEDVEAPLSAGPFMLTPGPDSAVS